MALKALIFAGKYNIYLNFIKEYRLDGLECQYANEGSTAHGYNKDSNPDLLIILLDGWEQCTASSLSYLVHHWSEFRGQIYNQHHRHSQEVAAQLIQLTYITKLEQLPEYLSHEDEKVRMAALKRQGKLKLIDRKMKK